MSHDDDHTLKHFLHQAHRLLDPPAPSFGATLEAARRRRRRAGPRWRPVLATVAVALTLTVAGLATFLRRAPSHLDPAEALELAERLSQWRAPTDFLARAPGSDLLETLPRVHRATALIGWTAATADLATSQTEKSP